MFLLLAIFVDWRDHAVTKRRIREGACLQCGYSRTDLPRGAACPECGASAVVSAPTPVQNFPYFILIADEQSFVKAINSRDLNWFEQPDIEEMIHWAWDTKGRKYKLVWARTLGPCPELVAENGIADFRAAVDEYQKRLAARGIYAPHYGLCEPGTLLAALKAMEQDSG